MGVVAKVVAKIVAKVVVVAQYESVIGAPSSRPCHQYVCVSPNGTAQSKARMASHSSSLTVMMSIWRLTLI